MTKKNLSAHELRRLAVTARVDPRTALKFWHGHPCASLTEERLQAAMRRLRWERTVDEASRVESR